MSMKRIAKAVGAMAAVTIAAVIAIRASGPSPTAGGEPGGETSTIAGVEARLAELGRSVASVERLARTASPAPPAFPGEPRPADEAATATAPRPAEPTAAQVRDSLDRRFFSEREDPVWRDKATALAYQRLAAIPGNSVVREVACRRSFCRIETTHADRAAFQSFVEAAFLSPTTQLWNSGFTAALIDEADTDGSAGGIHAVAYLAREGEALPSPEELMATR